ncbi:hypothetical protein [Methylopila sp. M107]|uniref:hypothetical protein n=1 Tax=Methylopila sp. M107 TaxID=1101190 RepID=UPI000361EC7C|nr:hypothetical protein [Methylopila sp. M107]
MNSERERKLSLSDPGREAAGDELERILEEQELAEAGEPTEDAGFGSFLERFPIAARRSDAPG